MNPYPAPAPDRVPGGVVTRGGEAVFYRAGYKYQLAENFRIVVAEDLWPEREIDTEFLRLTVGGTLQIAAGYAWDGASGPVVDRPSTMVASLVHDALYQLMRLGLLDAESHRRPADACYERLCRRDGMWWWWARLHLRALERFGGVHASPESQKPIRCAP